MWYHEVIGGGRCPIVDTGGRRKRVRSCSRRSLGRSQPSRGARPGHAGIVAEVVDKKGHPWRRTKGLSGHSQTWPAMLRTIFNDDERYKQQYWSQTPGSYFTADGARVDEDGYFWIMGRVDDVLNVSGHRLSTMEVESALVHHPKVAEAAVVGRPDDIKGEAISCFVTLKAGIEPSEELKKELREHVVHEIGALARPDDIRFSESLPKTRSGKIMRRLLRDVAAGRASTQDTSTLEDFSVLTKCERMRINLSA